MAYLKIYIQSVSVEWAGFFLTLLCYLYYVYDKHQKRILNHNENLFKKVKELLSYQKAVDFFDQLDNCYFNPEYSLYLNSINKLLKEPNVKFNSPAIEKSKKELVSVFSELSIFITSHFFYCHNLLMLYPEQKNSPKKESRDNYLNKSKDLEIIVKKCREALDDFYEKCEGLSV